MTSVSSHVMGSTDEPLLELTIGQALERAASRWSDATALVSRHQDVRLTWSQLLEAADDFAVGLMALGVGRGDRVGIWAPTCWEWTVCQFATARAGLVLVNINPAYRASELEYTLRKVGVKALVCATSFKNSDYIEMVESVRAVADSDATSTLPQRLPALRYCIKIGGPPREGWLTFDQVSASGRERSQESLRRLCAELTPQDPINVQFTSGTTGLPKGATLSHHNVLNNAYFVGRGMGLREGDRLCVPVPLYHCFGMVMSNLACLLHGATMVYPSAGFDARAVLETVEAERCTALHGVPTMFIAELDHSDFERFDLSSLRTGIMAGAPCPIEVMNKVLKRMHLRDIGIAYGMTETSPVSFQTALDDPIDRRVGTIGRVQPHIEVKVVDPLTGETVPRGAAGELCTKGYSVMLGYWDDHATTAKAIQDGWMRTGDLAILDEQGYARIVGRLKDMIIRGGENIYPREIEEFLYRHPKIQDVQVVGVPDIKYGEEVCACIRLRDATHATADEILEFCRGQIAHYKMPRYIQFVTDFPMTVTGKVQKHLLRKQVARELGVEDTNAV